MLRYDVLYKLIIKSLEAIPYKNGYVLDLACGKGRHSIFLSNLGYNGVICYPSFNNSFPLIIT